MQQSEQHPETVDLLGGGASTVSSGRRFEVRTRTGVVKKWLVVGREVEPEPRFRAPPRYCSPSGIEGRGLQELELPGRGHQEKPSVRELPGRGLNWGRQSRGSGRCGEGKDNKIHVRAHVRKYLL